MKRSDFQLIAIVGIILGVLLLAGGIFASFYYESYMIIRIYRVYPYAEYSGSLLRAGAVSIFVGIASVLLAPKMSETKVNETKLSETKPKKMVRRSVAIALGIGCIILMGGIVGAFAYYHYTPIISGKDTTISSLNTEFI